MIIHARDFDYQLFFRKNIQECKQDLETELENRRIFVITNTTVYGLYAHSMEDLLRGSSFHWIVIEDGEEYKNWSTFIEVVEQVDSLGVTRDSLVIGFGGGVVGDLAGFVAATILRGIDYIAVPTTLLAMVDSSIGGKTAINTKEGKNRLGSFYPPKKVLMPFACLQSLPTKEIQCGLGEIVKHGLLGSEKILALIENNAPSILNKDLPILIELVQISCEIKGAIVMNDEREKGLRKTLNLGHTIAHSIEKVLNYREITHGHAVAIGLVTELRWMASQGYLSREVVRRISAIFKRLDMSTKIDNIDKEACVQAISFDKKCKYDMITLSIIKEIGVAYNLDIPIQEVSKIVDHMFLGEEE